MSYTKLRNSISCWLDETIEPEELVELQSLLTRDADARRVYLEYMSVHAELCNVASAQDCLRMLTDVNSDLAAIDNASPRSSWRSPLLVIAAGLLLAIGITTAVQKWNQDSVGSSAGPPILAKVEPASEECTWYVEQAERLAAHNYLSGDLIRVTSGKLEIQYLHGSKVILHSPAAYQLITGMKSRMLLGRLTATVTDAGKGFSVLTPRATVIDLGTEFGVEVNNDGATDVVVFKGEVDVDYNDHTDHSNARRLRMGEAVHFDSAGTASRIVSINGRTYSSETLKGLPQPAVINEVYDNIERTSSLMSYYEIVQQGMQEDALAFVDREAHQWNGCDESGIPEYLIGADYVKMFNNDKFNHNISVSVKLAMPANLYVLFDDRLPIPAWLAEGFQDTGDNIGMDTGPFFSNGYWHNTETPPGIGPANSVEDTLSIWVKEVSEPGIVYLDSTEAPRSEPNMYGIAATPLNFPLSTPSK